jgi:hypothetical protein
VRTFARAFSAILSELAADDEKGRGIILFSLFSLVDVNKTHFRRLASSKSSFYLDFSSFNQ